MYRPNRIGPYPVWDLDAAAITWPTEWTTDFAEQDHDVRTAPRLHVPSATLRDDYDQATWLCSEAAITLAAGMAVGIGIGISGVPAGDSADSVLGHLYCGHVDAMICRDVDQELIVRPVIGRASQSTLSVDRDAQGNTFGSYGFMPSDTARPNQRATYCSWQGCIAQGNLGAAALGTNPVMLGAWIGNPTAAANQVIRYLAVSVSIHKYVRELQQFDPVR